MGESLPVISLQQKTLYKHILYMVLLKESTIILILYYIECFNDTYGIDCAEMCFCMNGGTCDSAIGCVCTDGWTGTNCTIGMWYYVCMYNVPSGI